MVSTNNGNVNANSIHKNIIPDKKKEEDMKRVMPIVSKLLVFRINRPDRPLICPIKKYNRMSKVTSKSAHGLDFQGATQSMDYPDFSAPGAWHASHAHKHWTLVPSLTLKLVAMQTIPQLPSTGSLSVYTTRKTNSSMLRRRAERLSLTAAISYADSLNRGSIGFSISLRKI